LDQDSGFNHGFPSGFFANSTANLNTIHIDAGCVDDPSASNGCSTSANALDNKRGTVFRLTFDPQAMGDFAGVQIEEPEHYGSLLGQGLPTGNSYDLTSAKKVIFYARSPDNASVQFGVGGCVGKFTKISSRWKKISLRLNTLQAPPGETPPPPCPPDIKHIHVLFSVGVDDVHGKNGATVLLDDIQFTPVPANRANVINFPLGNQTFGVVPFQIGDPPPIAFPADQVLRNLTTTYESAITLIALLARAKNGDVAHALEIVNAFDYALHNDNQGDPIPLASDGSAGLHNGYENGDLPLFNNQSPPEIGQAGNSRLAGFTATQECPATGFCRVLDGATGIMPSRSSLYLRPISDPKTLPTSTTL